MTTEVSLVVPVYNEQFANLQALVKELDVVMGSLRTSYELIFVDDGSSTETNLELRRLVANCPQAKLVVLSRNFGEQAAICAGLRYTSGAVSINMDSDLQDPPALIEKMLAAWREGYDIVLAKQVQRHEPLSKVIPSMIFYRSFNLLADKPIPVDVGEFRLLSRRVIDLVNQMPERMRFLREMIPSLGFKQLELPFVRADRHLGTSGYSLAKLIKLALQAVLVSSTKPLLMILPLAFLMTLVGLVCFVMSTVFPHAVELTNTQLASLNLVFAGFIICFTGILAPYLARIVTEVRARPVFIVSELVGFDNFQDRFYSPVLQDIRRMEPVVISESK